MENKIIQSSKNNGMQSQRNAAWYQIKNKETESGAIAMWMVVKERKCICMM